MTDLKEPFRWGTAHLTPELPDVWDANFLRVDRIEGLSAEGLIAESERVMGGRGFTHRSVLVDDETVGKGIAGGFQAAGWDVNRMVFMIHDGDTRPLSTVPVDEVVEAVHTAAKAEFDRRHPDIATDDVISQMRRLAHRVSEATDRRCFAAYSDDQIASVCELYSDGVTAQIEDVATLDEHRNKGLAKAVVLRALHEAHAWGHETIFLVADDESWPKQFYGKVGFEEAGRTYQFLLKPKDEKGGRSPAPLDEPKPFT